MTIPYLVRYLDYSGIEKWTHKAWPMQGSNYDTGALINTLQASLVAGSVLLDVWRLYPQPHYVYSAQSNYGVNETQAAGEALAKSWADN